MAARRLWASLLDSGRRFNHRAFSASRTGHRFQQCTVPAARPAARRASYRRTGAWMSLKALCARWPCSSWGHSAWGPSWVPERLPERCYSYSQRSDHLTDSSVVIAPQPLKQPHQFDLDKLLRLHSLAVYKSAMNPGKPVEAEVQTPKERLIQNLNDIIQTPSPPTPMSTPPEIDSDLLPPLRLLSDSDEDESSGVDAENYAFFKAKVDQRHGRLILRKEDLNSPDRWKALGLFLSSCPGVHVLRLQGMDISKSEAQQLGKGVLKEIRHLTFCENSIGLNENTLEYICGALLHCELLESAAFLRQSLTDMHLPFIFEMATDPRLQKLQSLSLAWNGFQNPGDTIMNYVRSCGNNLSLVDLSYNMLAEESVTSLAAFAEATTFKFITSHNDDLWSRLSAGKEGGVLQHAIPFCGHHDRTF